MTTDFWIKRKSQYLLYLLVNMCCFFNVGFIMITLLKYQYIPKYSRFLPLLPPPPSLCCFFNVGFIMITLWKYQYIPLVLPLSPTAPSPSRKTNPFDYFWTYRLKRGAFNSFIPYLRKKIVLLVEQLKNPSITPNRQGDLRCTLLTYEALLG